MERVMGILAAIGILLMATAIAGSFVTGFQVRRRGYDIKYVRQVSFFVVLMSIGFSLSLPVLQTGLNLILYVFVVFFFVLSVGFFCFRFGYVAANQEWIAKVDEAKDKLGYS